MILLIFILANVDTLNSVLMKRNCYFFYCKGAAVQRQNGHRGGFLARVGTSVYVCVNMCAFFFFSSMYELLFVLSAILAPV